MLEQPKIFNYCNVSELISIGGQPNIHQFKSLKEAGKKVVFQLVVEEAEYSVTNEVDHVTDLDLEHESMNISYAKPSGENVQQFINILEKHKAEPIYVHCAVGYCTSGLMVIYLMKTRQLSFENAKQLVVPDWQPSPIWTELIQTYID